MAIDYAIRLSAEDNLSGTLDNIQDQLDKTGMSAKKLDDIKKSFTAITTSSSSLKKKVADLRKNMLELAAGGKQNSELYEQMAATARTYQTAIDKVRKDTRGLTEETSILKGALQEIASKVGLGGVTSQLAGITSVTGAATMGIGAMATVMYKGAAAAADFDKHLDALQALTGLSDKGMTEIADGALEMSKKFGTSASGVADAMGLMGPRADPANVLSKAAGIEVVQAAKGITTVMNQMGVSAQRASDIINTLAAGSQKGSADVAYLQTAFEKAGTIASQSGLNFEELAGAIEAIAPKFSSAEVAGTSLAAFFNQLEKQANDEFKPSVVGIKTALDNLGRANMSTADQMKMFGDAGYSAAVTLITQRDQFAELTREMTGTNTAYEQMATVTDNFEGKMDRLKASWEAFLIVIGGSKWVSHIVDSVQDVMAVLGEIMEQIEGVVDAFDSLAGGAGGVSLIATELGLLKDILGVVLGFIEGFVRLITKAFDSLSMGARATYNAMIFGWEKFKGAMADVDAFKKVTAAIKDIKTTFKAVINGTKELWRRFLRWLGMEKPETPDEPIYDIEDISHGGTTNAAKAAAAQRERERKWKEEGKEATATKLPGNKAPTSVTDKQTVAAPSSDMVVIGATVDLSMFRAASEQAGRMVDQLQTKTGAGLEGNGIMDGMQARLDEQFEAFRAHRERIRGIIDGMQGDTAAGMQAFMDLATVLNDSMTSSTDKAAAGLATIGGALQQLGADGPKPRWGVARLCRRRSGHSGLHGLHPQRL